MTAAGICTLDGLVGLSGFRCIVADPPWMIGPPPARPRKAEGAIDPRTTENRAREYERGFTTRKTERPYAMMTVAEIEAMPVSGVADKDAHLYLWTINRYVEQAYSVARAWGFKPSTLLTWAKKPRGIMLGTFTGSTEFILFARRGTCKALRRLDTTWFPWPRHNAHSRKPEAFQDMVETVSPGPYLELFARRARPGWTVWGNEVEANNGDSWALGPKKPPKLEGVSELLR